MPRSARTRAAISRSTRARGALIHPTRSPPQKTLDALPIVTVDGSNDAKGAGIGSSVNDSDCSVSSTIAVVRE